MKNNFLNQSKHQLTKRFGKQLSNSIYNESLDIFIKLCEENKNESQKEKNHTNVKIYPAIALTLAQMNYGISREDSISFTSDFIAYRSNKMAKVLKLFLKIPNIYKKAPKFFEKMTIKNFGKEAKFDAIFYDTPQSMMRFDMLKCPYFDICKKYGLTEITKAFCKGDDIVYGNMHPKLVWNRKKTLGDGDDICDFNITSLE